MRLNTRLRWWRRAWRRRERVHWTPLAIGLWALAGLTAAVQLALVLLAGSAFADAHFSSPPPSTLLLDRQGRFLGEIAAVRGPRKAGLPHGYKETEDLGYWTVQKLPPRVVAATVALEDHRFGHHSGVDFVAVGRALRQNLTHSTRISGASTLAMQVARMQRPGARGYLRKVREGLTAILLTQRYGGQEILQQYLRIVPYGNRIHGISYAARSYFDKPVEDLSWAEIAFLAALPQAPARMNPFLPAGRERALRRGERLLAILGERGELNPAELRLAQSQLNTLRIPVRERRPPEALHALLHLSAQLAEHPMSARLTGRPLRTTLDLDLQRSATDATYEALERWRSRGAGNASLIVLDLARGEVLAWIGSADYFDDQYAGSIDYARIRRSAGSTLKPFLYAHALDRGVLAPTTLMDDLERGPGGISNADDAFLGPLLPRVALATSRNVPAVHLLGRLGLDEGYGLFRDLGLTAGAEPAQHYGLGLAIGGLPVTLEELARAYMALAHDGRLPARLRWLRDEPDAEDRRIFSEDAARQVTLFLSDPQARLPSFPRMGATEYRFPVAVKTGTSTNYHDAWAVAYSTKYLAAAWVGHPGFRAMNHLSGYLSAADLVRTVLSGLHQQQTDGLDDLSFAPPRGYQPVRVCALSGHRATAACDRVFLEWFRPGQEPPDECEVHQLRAIDRRNGLLATAATPPAAVEVRTFVVLPPRYASWQATAGLPRPPDAPSPLGGGALAAFREIPATPLTLAPSGPVRLEITSPERGAHLLLDPETPAERSSVALRVTVSPPVAEVVWYVDQKPFRTVSYPYTTRLPLKPGAHSIQVRLPAGPEVSRPVDITVDP
jgi:penicillin-binding protein 1C